MAESLPDSTSSTPHSALRTPHSVDPRNRLLWRQNRLRLEAESIRDAALATSGLLFTQMKGPSVHPPQPDGIYVLTQTKKPWPEETGPDRYRRGLYTHFWRSSPYPMLMAFDASDATTSCTRRARSNTPLQSLTLANDQAFHEMAVALAGRVLAEAADYDEDRLRFAFRAALSRDPSETELRVMTEFVDGHREYFQKHPEDARQVIGEPASSTTAPSEATEAATEAAATEAATWTAVARVLLNVDEFITRE